MASNLSIKDKLERVCPHFAHMHILYGKKPNITLPKLGLSGLPIAAKVYADRALISLDDNGGSKMIDDNLTMGNNEQGPIIEEDEANKIQQVEVPTHLFGWLSLMKILLMKA